MRKIVIFLILALFIITPIYQALAFDPRYQFTDQEKDAESGLYNFDVREYNPNIGRFNQPDPVLNNLANPQLLKQQTGQDLQELLKDPQNLNPYGYTRNNPVRYVDPKGESVMEVIRGQQSLSAFQIEVGDNAEIRYQDSKIWRTVLDHPYIFSTTLALGTPLLAAGASFLASLGLIAIPMSQTQRIFQGDQSLRLKEAVASAQQKLQEVSNVIGKSVDYILKQADKSKSVFTDLRPDNLGNVNVFFKNPTNSEKLIRITLDPTLNKIISAGIDRINQVEKWINNGSLTNFIK